MSFDEVLEEINVYRQLLLNERLTLVKRHLIDIISGLTTMLVELAKEELDDGNCD